MASWLLCGYQLEEQAIIEVFANTWEVLNDRDTKLMEIIGRTDAGKQ